jgi:dissimilatory sulfite reductase (desulfoviridin) alpha/beta subunit
VIGSWFLRGLRRRVVTTRYPARPEPSATALPSPPAFRADLITDDLADRLVAACPSGALVRERGELRYDVGACTSCGRCAAVAEDVVRPSGLVELAVTERGQLVKWIPIGGADA